jgi:hypothetical protein
LTSAFPGYLISVFKVPKVGFIPEIRPEYTAVSGKLFGFPDEELGNRLPSGNMDAIPDESLKSGRPSVQPGRKPGQDV